MNGIKKIIFGMGLMLFSIALTDYLRYMDARMVKDWQEWFGLFAVFSPFIGVGFMVAGLNSKDKIS